MSSRQDTLPDSPQSTDAPRLEPGSFRDPDSRVFYSRDGVLRALSEEGLVDWNALASSSLFSEAVAEGKLVGTELVQDSVPLPKGFGERPAAVLRHEVVPFVSYPYEWPFGMLREAAIVQLELLRRALRENLILKDSSPYNVQWRGSKPVFIDVGSFERLRDGEPWAGYRQFCMLYLYPLLLQAYKNVPFQPWLRGSIGGISPQQCRSLMSARDLLRRGVLAHVYLHSKLENRYADAGRDIKRELRAAGFHKEMIVANVKRLERLLKRLDWRPPRSAWSQYGPTTNYTAADTERKAQFVREIARSTRWGLVWDLGCNDGRYSRIAAEAARYVVAIDADTAVVENLYRSLKDEGSAKILPLVMDVADPSPPLGWKGLERRTLAERGTPDLTLCLALVHHTVITANIPVADFIGWLRALGAALVIEFPTRDDPRVQRLLAAKKPGSHPDYDREWFERCLSERFEVERSEVLSSGTRMLYFARPRL